MQKFKVFKIPLTNYYFSDKQGNLDDLTRIYYYKHYLNQMLRSILEVNIFNPKKKSS